MPTKSTQKTTSPAARPKRVTLRDIAEIAGVHVMTVSDALNGTRSVAPATRENIRRIARELNYVPNSAARALVSGRSKLIAVISGILTEPYYAHMAHLLVDNISASGFHMLLIRTENEVKEVVNATSAITVDGAIMIDRLGIVEEFKSRTNLPCVSIGTSKSLVADSVLIDLSAGVEEALHLMIAAGRQRIAYLVTAPGMESNAEVRARVYRDTMQAAHRSPEIINVAADEMLVIERRFSEYVQRNGAPDALFCQNDETAICAFHVLRSLGYAIPDDVLLAGCDGQLHMKYFDPPLSTIVQPLEEICNTAWDFLQRRINQPDLPHQSASFEGQLAIRKSLIAAEIGDDPKT